MNGLPLLVVATAMLAQSPAPEKSAAWLVSFDELERQRDDPSLRLIDARPRDEYDKGHIKGGCMGRREGSREEIRAAWWAGG